MLTRPRPSAKRPSCASTAGRLELEPTPFDIADLTGFPVCRVTYQETTALGAALFAGLASGVYASMEEAASRRPQSELLAPADDGKAREAAYARWLDAVPRVRS